MCPTEYNRAWAGSDYLDVLGRTLDPSIQIMWTGNSVVADITREGLEWVNRRIQRPAYVWWNFPVSDYCRDHLLMGPAYGLDSDVTGAMSGFVSNPMERAEASKVALFGVAGYAWNLQAYSPEKSFDAACRYPPARSAGSIPHLLRKQLRPGSQRTPLSSEGISTLCRCCRDIPESLSRT